MEQALALKLPIIGVNLNGLRQQDPDRCPATIRAELAVYIPFKPAIMQYALEHWPASVSSLRTQGKTGPFYYPESTYRELGI